MAGSDLVNPSAPLDDAKRFALVRQYRWLEGVCCPVCDSGAVIRNGHDDMQPCRQRCRCKACSGRFDDLTGTVPMAVTQAPCGGDLALMPCDGHGFGRGFVGLSRRRAG